MFIQNFPFIPKPEVELLYRPQVFRLKIFLVKQKQLGWEKHKARKVMADKIRQTEIKRRLHLL